MRECHLFFRRLGVFLAILCWQGIPTASAQVAPPKIALLIGNSAYASSDWPSLANPVRDVRLMRQSLERAGFDVLLPAIDLPRDKLVGRLDEFRQRAAQLPEGSIALIYYSGHGIQVDGTNYIVPANSRTYRFVEAAAAEDKERILGTEYVSLNFLLDSFSPQRREQKGVANVLILDACRVNPLEGRTRGVGRPKGLADVPNTANTLIAFAAAPGTVAYDGEGENSPYAAAVAREFQQKSLPLELIFTRVTSRTLELTEGLQRPDYKVGLSGVFCLEECMAEAVSTAIAAPVPRAPTGGGAGQLARAAGATGVQLPELVSVAGLRVSRFPVSARQWQACVEQAACTAPREEPDSMDLPAVRVTWADASEYVAWLNSRGEGHWRLPTRDEWLAVFAPRRAEPRQARGSLPRLRASTPGDGSVAYVGQIVEWTSDCADDPQRCGAYVAMGVTHDDPASDLLSQSSFGPGTSGSALGFRVVQDDQITSP